MPGTQDLIGKKIGDYEIVGVLGSGGMAEVFKGYDPDREMYVAVKLMHAFLTEDEKLLDRFKREAEVMAQLDHPNIVRMLHFDAYAEKTYYLVMEFIDGETLRTRIQQLAQLDEILTLEETVAIMQDVADALAYAHDKKMVHRDIKPANVMIRPDGEAILTDFGIVKLMNQTAAFTATGSILGTPAYMAPEQALGEPGDTRSDIYSLGVMLFQMITGKLPFDADTPMGIIMKHVSEPTPLPGTLNPQTPLSLHHIIIKAMAKEPDGRFQTAADLIDALNAVDTGGKEATAPTLPDLPPQEEIETKPAQTLPPPFQAPSPVPHFTGRHDELNQIEDRLTDAENGRLVGLVGFGGVGKTAVAIEAAHTLRHTFPDGILWAQLDYGTPETELVKFADAFGQAETVAQKHTLAQKADFVRQLLAHKRVLIIIDQAQDSEQVKWLIPTGDNNATLITTRNGKMLSNLGADIVPVRAFSERDGLAYLRAIVSRQRFQAERDAAAALIRLVGGLPLALSIVAGFLNEATGLTIGEYVDLLQDEQTRLANLTDWEDAARDVAASFELSYQQLPPPIRRLFAVLSIFDGPDFATRDVAIIARVPPVQAKMGLGRLHALSLIGAGLGERELLLPLPLADDGRYRINPLLRLFAREKLGAEETDFRRRAADYFANLAHLNRLPDGYPRLDLEWQNVMGALAWAHRHQAWQPLLMGVQALTHTHLGVVGFMDARGHWSEARELLTWALAGTTDPLLQARLHLRLAAFAIKQSDRETAVSHLDTAQEIVSDQPRDRETALKWAYLCDYRHRLALQDDPQAALAWTEQGIAALVPYEDETIVAEQGYLHILRAGVLVKTGNLDEAIVTAQQGLTLLPDTPTAARVGGLINLGTAAYLQGDLADSITHFEQAIPQARSLGDFRRLATATMNLGILQEQEGEFDTAITNYRQALRLHRGLGNHDDEGSAHVNLGSIYTKLGDDELAQEHLQTAVALGQQFDLTELEAFAQVGLAELLLTNEAWETAVSALDRAAAICDAAAGTFAFLRPIITRLQARAAQLQDHHDAALRLINEALALAEADEYQLEQGIGWRVKGTILAAQKDAAARAAFETSLDLLATQSPYEHAKSKLALVQFLLASDEETAVAEADTLLQTAVATFSELNTRRELGRARRLQTRVSGLRETG